MSEDCKFIHLEKPEEMMLAYDLISQFYDQFSREEFFVKIKKMHQQNDYKIVAIYQGENMVAVAGYWVLSMLYCSDYIQISNFVVDQNLRGRGLGTKMLRYFEKVATKLSCSKIILDSYTENKKSHNLYFKEGFYIRGFHFMKDL